MEKLTDEQILEDKRALCAHYFMRDSQEFHEATGLGDRNRALWKCNQDLDEALELGMFAVSAVNVVE